MASGAPSVELAVGDRTVRLSNPDRVYFPARGETKLDLARYYLSVADGIVRALRDRPCMLHRFPTGVTGEKVHQKRLPRGAFVPFGLVAGKNFMEYDLVHLAHGLLFWGARHVDGRGFDSEANRPTNLQIPLARRPD